MAVIAVLEDDQRRITAIRGAGLAQLAASLTETSRYETSRYETSRYETDNDRAQHESLFRG
jgi:pyruvate-formate lyase